jgi:hypothetical protein
MGLARVAVAAGEFHGKFEDYTAAEIAELEKLALARERTTIAFERSSERVTTALEHEAAAAKTAADRAAVATDTANTRILESYDKVRRGLRKLDEEDAAREAERLVQAERGRASLEGKSAALSAGVLRPTDLQLASARSGPVNLMPRFAAQPEGQGPQGVSEHADIFLAPSSRRGPAARTHQGQAQVIALENRRWGLARRSLRARRGPPRQGRQGHLTYAADDGRKSPGQSDCRSVAPSLRPPFRAPFPGSHPGLAKFAAITFGAEQIFEQIKKTQEAANLFQETQARLKVSMKNAGISWEEYEKRIEGTTHALREQTGFTDFDIQDSLANAIRATGHAGSAAERYAKAWRIVQTALDIARTKLIGWPRRPPSWLARRRLPTGLAAWASWSPRPRRGQG